MRLALSLPPPSDVVARLVDGAVASRIARADPSVWADPVPTGWVDAARATRPLAGEIAALREALRVAGITRVIAATAGGAGVAAEALAAGEPRLVVLDTPDPGQVADALAGDLDATVLVVSVPPGADRAAVDLVAATVERAFRAEGLDPATRTVVVAAPGGPVPTGATLVAGPPQPGGPWSALSAYALVPAGLAGVDAWAASTDAAAVGAELAADSPANPALILGALLATSSTVALAGPGPVAWVAQLLAERSDGGRRGPLPVAVEGDGAPGWSGPGALAIGVGEELPGAAACTLGPPAAQMLLWQHAVAVAAHLLDTGPGPVADAVPPPDEDPAFTEGAVAVHAGPWLPAGTATVADAMAAFVGPGDGHLAVHAYLDREGDASVAVLRAELARRTGRSTTFDWAPRGPRATAQGTVVCQLTGDPEDGGELDLHELQQSLARADAAELARRGHPVLRLHLADRLAGLVTVVRAVQHL